MHTRREVVELLAPKTKCSLVSQYVGVIQGCLIHELQCLSDKEHREDDEVDLPS